MGQQLDVITSAELRKRTRLLCLFFWPFAVLGIVQIVHDIRRGRQLDEWVWMIGVIAMVAIGPFFLYLGRGKEVKRFDEQGVTTRSGRVFSWDRFVRVADYKRRRMHNHFELHFEDGVAVVADLMADNYAEIREVIAELEAGTSRFRS
jgi:hypothetical protein